MGRERKEGLDQALTVIVVPGSSRMPVSVRVPRWAVSLAPLAALGLVFGLLLLVGEHYRMAHRLEELERQRTLALQRQDEMRRTILAQQEEVKALHEEVSVFRLDLDRVRSLGQQIAALMGWEGPPTPTPEPAQPQGLRPGRLAAAMGGVERAGETAYPGMALAGEIATELRGLQGGLPDQILYLEELRGGLVDRLQRMEASERGDPRSVARQLQLMTAAPKGLPVWGQITSGFGWRVFRGRQDFHTGVDLGVWYGTQVRATADGVVVHAGWYPGYGWTVILDHQNGFKTLYAHNSWYLVDPGERVSKGQVIALSGSSGYSSGPHLHYEMLLYGIPVDPLFYAFLD